MFDKQGFSTFEHALQFDTRGWGRGTYTAEVIIRDEIANEVSQPGTTRFQLSAI